MQFIIQRTSDGVYHSTITRVTDKKEEIFYFGMELLDENNLDKWSYYKTDMSWFTTRGRGLFSVLPFLCKKNPPVFDSQLAEVTGFCTEEYNNFIKDLCDKKMYSPEKENLLDAISSGIAGFTFFKGDYIVYVNTSPITGRYPFPIRDRPWLTLKKFNIAYKDIIMTMRSDMNFSEKDTAKSEVFNNRGIFRNPKSVIDGGNNNVSVLLHSFSATVARQHFNKLYLSVSALPVMTSILLKSSRMFCYKNEDIIKLENGKYSNAVPGCGGMETKLLIKISGLLS
jgi:hypothetical protein